jgi:hypothetical protein
MKFIFSGLILQQHALKVAIAEIKSKTDLRIKVKSLERSKHRRVAALNFEIDLCRPSMQLIKLQEVIVDNLLPTLQAQLTLRQRTPTG